MSDVDYLREILFLCLNPVTWLLAIVLTRKQMNLSTILLGSASCQLFSITLPYLFLQNAALMFSLHSAVLFLLLSLCTGCSIGFFVYGLFAQREHEKRLSS